MCFIRLHTAQQGTKHTCNSFQARLSFCHAHTVVTLQHALSLPTQVSAQVFTVDHTSRARVPVRVCVPLRSHKTQGAL